MVFKGKNRAYGREDAHEYSVDIELFDKIVADKVKTNLTGKHLAITIPKADLKKEYWPRLTKDKKKLAFLKTDFNKCVTKVKLLVEQRRQTDPHITSLQMG